MKRIQKYFLFLVNLTIMASLCFAGQYSVSAQSRAQAVIEVVSPPLFPDLTWKNLGNVQKDVHVYDQILNLSGNMFAAIEIYQNGIPESVFDYYSARNLESLGWSSVGRSGFESTYWHSSGRYLTVRIEDCPNFRADYCVNVWQSVESSSLPLSAAPSPAGRLSVAPLSAASVTALAALNKLTPTNGSTIALPANSYRVLTWTDAGIGSTDRYQYCIDDTNNQTCNSTWIERNSTYSGDGEFTLATGKTYYWQVRTKEANVYADGETTWWSFTVGTSTAFVKTTPTSGSATGLPTSTQYFLQWSALSGMASTDRYQYCIDETNNASCDSNNWITRDSLYSGSGEFTLVSGKTYYWQVRARDANVYANSGSWWSFTISGTTSGPTVSSIVRGNPTSSTTNATSVIFTVTFSTSVTGVDLVAPFNDFGLATSGITGAGITTVTGSGTTYNVTVNTGVGDGTIRLDVVDNDSIKNSQNTPLGGAGMGNGSYAAGQTYTIDKAPIVLSIKQPNPPPVNLINVNFTVTFSESVALLGVNDLALVTTGVSGAAMTGVSGSGSVYTVTVNTGTGNGTIHLNLVDDDSIRDVSGNPLGGPGFGNGDFTSGDTYTITKNIEAYVGVSRVGAYSLAPSQGVRDSFVGVSGGPVKVASLDGSKIVSAIRLQAMTSSGTLYSFVETMGVPKELISDKYYFPTYNNTWAPLNSQVRFANLGTLPTTIRVTIGGNVVGTYPSVPAQGERREYYNVSGGPVIVESLDGTKIIAAIRLQSMDASGTTLYSFAETMGVPKELISDTYYFPTYNNTWTPLNSQVRFANLGTAATDIRVTIGGIEMGTYNVPAQGERREYYNISGGPVKVESLNPANKIIAAIRLQSMTPAGTLYSFVETMGVPKEVVTDKYYFPVYNNTWAPLNSQVRFANLGTLPTTIRVTIGGTVVGTYPNVPAQGERREYYPVSGGPVIVESLDGAKITAAIRLQSMDTSGTTLYSFAETMGVPKQQLSDTNYFPTYNNTWAPLDSQLRFGIP